MSGRRRSDLAVAADLRVREQRVELGSEIRASRERRGWTQYGLAQKAGISRHILGRVERAMTHLDLDLMQRISIALERRLEIRFSRDPFEAPADAGHLGVQELVLRLGRNAGYIGGFELATRQSEPWRSIDVILAAPDRGWVLLCECWNSVGDIGAAVRSTSRKAAELDAIAAGRFGPGIRIASVWVMRAIARNRALVNRYPEVFAARFPGSSRQWVRTLTDGTPPPGEPGLVWCDAAATHLFAWRRR